MRRFQKVFTMFIVSALFSGVASASFHGVIQHYFRGRQQVQTQHANLRVVVPFQFRGEASGRGADVVFRAGQRIQHQNFGSAEDFDTMNCSVGVGQVQARGEVRFLSCGRPVYSERVLAPQRPRSNIPNFINRTRFECELLNIDRVQVGAAWCHFPGRPNSIRDTDLMSIFGDRHVGELGQFSIDVE